MIGGVIAAARWTVDAHVHLYGRFGLAEWFGSLSRNLAACGRSDVYAAIFAERRDCHAFAELSGGKLRADGVTVHPVSGAGGMALRVRRDNDDPVWLLPGRQLVTAEGVEMLAWLIDTDLPGRLPVDEAVAAIRAAGGIPAVNWAPGKWWFRRGAIVKRLLEHAGPGPLCLCDTTLRPAGWPEPAMMLLGSQKGLPVLAGSDSLPLRGEDKYAGLYASVTTGSFDPADPVNSMRKLLTGSTRFDRVGRRNGFREAFKRLACLAVSRG